METLLASPVHCSSHAQVYARFNTRARSIELHCMREMEAIEKSEITFGHHCKHATESSACNKHVLHHCLSSCDAGSSCSWNGSASPSLDFSHMRHAPPAYPFSAGSRLRIWHLRCALYLDNEKRSNDEHCTDVMRSGRPLRGCSRCPMEVLEGGAVASPFAPFALSARAATQPARRSLQPARAIAAAAATGAEGQRSPVLLPAAALACGR
jgi:hypothetical protein